MCRKRFLIIGITEDSFNRDKEIIKRMISGSKREDCVFSGGRRHHHIVRDILPENHRWIEIGSPVVEALSAYRKEKEIVVFASGDPLFYGLGETVLREFPTAEVEILPYLNSIQLLSSKLLLPYGKIKIASLTGKDWNGLDQELIRGSDLIGVLTDKKKNPNSIAERMSTYGYTNYLISVGENLGSRTEKITKDLTIDQIIDCTFQTPNCLILRKVESKQKYFGIPDRSFAGLEGRPNMITKMPIRLTDLAMLELIDRKVLWDIGFCTGSVSIEARLNFPHLDIVAFEKRKECEEIFSVNTRKFGTPGIKTLINDFFSVNLSELKAPDSVFIGGYGGKLKEMLNRLTKYMNHNCVVVFNSVSERSRDDFKRSAEDCGLKVIEEHTLKVDSFNPVTIIKALWEC